MRMRSAPSTLVAGYRNIRNATARQQQQVCTTQLASGGSHSVQHQVVLSDPVQRVLIADFAVASFFIFLFGVYTNHMLQLQGPNRWL